MTDGADERVLQAREHHQASLKSSAWHRAERDRLVRELRESDPQRWTYVALADAVGISKELVYVIITGKRTAPEGEA
jgi:hypothetical protein